MAGDAHLTIVGDYVTLVRGTTYKGALVGEPGPALLGLGSIEPGGGFRIGNYKTYGGDCPGELMLFPGDIYASLKGATKDGKMIGSVARVPPSVPTGRLTQDTVKLVFQSSDPVAQTYLYWVLRTPQYREYCAGHAMGSAVVALSRRDFLAYPVPPLTTQRRMAITLLDAIEGKIELNRQMNETLEHLVGAFFESEFGSCRTYAGDGNQGANCVPLLEFIEVNPSRAGVKGMAAPYLDMANVPTRGARALEIQVRPGGGGARFVNGDTLVARITPCLENGKTCFVDFLNDGVVGWGSTEFIVLRPKPPVPPPFAYFLARTAAFRSHLIANMTGTSGRQRVPADCLSALRCRVPKESSLKRFDTLASAHLAKIKSNDVESQMLGQIRDALLPNLLSGEVRGGQIPFTVTGSHR